MRYPEPIEVVAGSTLRLTWINSGTSPSPIISVLENNSGTMISSRAGVASGNGHFYADHSVPSTPGQWYLAWWYATLSTNTYASPQLVHAFRPEVS